MHTPLESDQPATAASRHCIRPSRSTLRRITRFLTAIALALACAAVIACPLSAGRRIAYEGRQTTVEVASSLFSVQSRLAPARKGQRTQRGWLIEKLPARNASGVSQYFPNRLMDIYWSPGHLDAEIPLLWISASAALVALFTWAAGRARTWKRLGLYAAAASSTAAGALWIASVVQTTIYERTRSNTLVMMDAGRFVMSTLPPKTRLAQFMSDIVGTGDVSRVMVLPGKSIRTSCSTLSLWRPRFETLSTTGVSKRFVYVPLWMPFAAAATTTLALAWWTRRLKARPGHCPHCNYDLTGNQTKKCPECGTPIPASVTASPNGATKCTLDSKFTIRNGSP